MATAMARAISAIRCMMERFEAWLIKHPRLWSLYVRWNFCKPEYADGTLKEDTLFFKVFRKVFYLECSCCSALRGLLVGFILGVLICQL
jgi:hypothetical protein